MLRNLLGAFLSFIVVLLILIGWVSMKVFFSSITVQQQPVTYIVPPHTSLLQLARELHHENIIKNPDYLILLAALQGKLRHIKAGEYKIKPDTTAHQLLEQLANGRVVLHKLTLIEGWNFNQVMDTINNNPAIAHTLTGKTPEEVMTSLSHPGENPEGLLFPDTYLFTLGTKDTTLLQMAYRLMQKRLNRAWEKRAQGLPYTDPYEALIVASLIEKEVAQANERPVVAGVILRRLQQQMRLQIDASVIYGLGKKFTGQLTRTDLTTDTSYNTYTRKGLPPTPIAMPSEASIQAAMNPAPGTFLYYVAKSDGSRTHAFSNTYEEHTAAVNKYLSPKNIRLVSPQSLLTVSPTLMVKYWTYFLGSEQQPPLCTYAY